MVDHGVAVPARSPECIASGGECLAHPLTEFTCGAATERDQQQLVDSGRTLGDVAGRQSRDGERLPRARAGLQERRSRRQRSEHVERGAGHRPPPAFRTGCQRRRASIPNLVFSSNQFSAAVGFWAKSTARSVSGPHRAITSGRALSPYVPRQEP